MSFEIENTEAQPSEVLIDKLKQLQDIKDPNISIVETDPCVIGKLTDDEAHIASILVDAAVPTAELYRRYLSDYPKDENWNRFSYEAAGYTTRIAEIFQAAANFAQTRPQLGGFAEHLTATAYDWQHIIHRFHPLSRSEIDFLTNRDANHQNLAVRSSCGLERYVLPSGYNASLNLRIGEAIETDPRMQMIQNVIFQYLGAASLQDKIDFTFRKDYFILGAGHHGKTPSGSQYTKIIDGKLYVIVNSNVNIQRKGNTELEEFAKAIYSPNRVAKSMPAILDSDIELIGHEIAEAIIETLYPAQINSLVGRESVEIASNLVILDALRKAKNYFGSEYGRLHEDASWRLLSRMMLRRTSGKDSAHMRVYSEGYDLALNYLESANAFNFVEGKIDTINWANFDGAIQILTQKLLDIIKSGNKSRNDELFAIVRQAY